jgi:hypothetical protein
MLPPAFGIGRVPLTMSNMDRLSSMSDPSEWEYLLARNRHVVPYSQKSHGSWLVGVDIHVKAGSWLPCAIRTKSKSSDLQSEVKNLYGYVSVDVLGATMAVEGKLPLDTLQPKVLSYFTMDVSGDGPPL